MTWFWMSAAFGFVALVFLVGLCLGMVIAFVAVKGEQDAVTRG